jgi:phospholipase/carboxylesterase
MPPNIPGMPHSPELQYLEIGAAKADADLCVILMHGLGADGHDFEDVATMLCQAAQPKRWRFVLPHSNEIPVTINMGHKMPAWYDILDLSHPREVNWTTVETSQRQIESLIAAESAPKIILAGFSQGAAMALHVGLRNQEKIAGILAMSGYLLQSGAHPAPPSKGPLPISILHGNADDVVPIKAAELALHDLKQAGYSPSFKSYIALGHSVSQEEVRDVFEWLEEHSA